MKYCILQIYPERREDRKVSCIFRLLPEEEYSEWTGSRKDCGRPGEVVECKTIRLVYPAESRIFVPDCRNEICPVE